MERSKAGNRSRDEGLVDSRGTIKPKMSGRVTGKAFGRFLVEKYLVRLPDAEIPWQRNCRVDCRVDFEKDPEVIPVDFQVHPGNHGAVGEALRRFQETLL